MLLRRATASLILTLSLLSVLLLTSPASHSQIVGPGELPAIDAGTRAAIIDSITAVIDSIYVLEEPAKRIVAGLKKNLADGKYDDVNDPAEFANRLYEDAQSISHDGHFRIAAMMPLDPAIVEADQDEDPADAERQRRQQRARNYGFKAVEILPGGVGYIRFDQFSHGEDAFATAASAMNFVANSNAVIIDLRHNGGGSAAMIRFLCGYLFEEKAHLINWDIRAENKTVQSYSADYVPGRRLPEQPVYVLTSGNTFSAAEEFTFDLKNLERATVVGDTTGGGGHTVNGYVFDFDGFRILIRLPYGRAYNPENNEGWEGVGVIPDIAVPSEQALEAAHATALRNLIDTEEDEAYKAGLEWALLDLDSRLEPVEISKKQMKEYVGQYGPRRIFIDGGGLFYQRDDRAAMRMEPMAEDLFRVGDLDYFRLTFERDSKGKIVKIVGLYDNGRSDGHDRE
jgi:hypothetical protein